MLTGRINADDQLRSAVADPSLEVASVHNTENQDHAVLLDQVVHHPVVAHTQAVE